MPLNQAKKVILDVLFDNAATRLVGKYGEAIIADLIVVAEKNGNLAKTIGIAKDGNNVRWLEEGTSSWGWTHIKNEHWTDLMNVFGPKTEQQVQEMILETIRSGEITKAIPGDQYKYTKEFLDENGVLQKLHVVVSDRYMGIGRGNTVTAYPEKIL